MLRLIVAAAAVCGMACGGGGDADVDLGPAPPPSTVDRDSINPRLLRRFKPLRRPEHVDDEVAALGKMLYFEPRLSKNGNVSCNTCHAIDRGGGGADVRALSVGTGGRPGKRNAPTVLNAAWHVAQFWDGRAADLEQQASGPILNPDEMAMGDAHAVTAMLQGIPGYVSAFGRAFPGEPVDLPHAAKAIATFEKTLVSPARWDRFLLGEQGALSQTEKDGVKAFADLGCVQCHTGELIGGSMFQKVGVSEPWSNQTDQGRFDITKQDADRMVFKVPSLRNVAITGPYFHDGMVVDLPTAVKLMGKHQLGLDLTPIEIASISAWLGSLSGDPLAIEPPVLP
jgi:cytochrome c peroxidase